ncbi:eukaryotic translation initiation factor 4B [Agrilus planipennis]|uniref:Eukaryotic translation initiation factor 4B n=1 Tax=Agrilus planipennis TaxID=224129 RepID=A0A1W4WJ12_AGRPL|nr:eukaryotic translation initiation factor 4B [Agrilus planipennis]
MASSGKKGKKTKGKTLALNDFLQETTGSTPSLPLRKTNLNWADDVEEPLEYETRPKINVVLPTAPKASRGVDEYNERIPKEPPFIAYLTNLPYDVDEEEIESLFSHLKIANTRFPKEDRASDLPRLKGYGYIEFEDRDSLTSALSMPDCMLKNRRIRIEVATSLDNDKQRRGRNDMNRDRIERGDTGGDWRSGPRGSDFSDFSRDREGGFNRDRDGGGGFNRDREGGAGFNRDREGGGGFSRDRDRDGGFNREREGGSWRESSDRPSNRGFNREGFGDRGRFGGDRDGGERRGGFSQRRGDKDDRDGLSRNKDEEKAEPRIRPKLMLAPRTKPIAPSDTEDIQQKQQQTQNIDSGAPPPAQTAASIFGAARPVDTAAREREIESKLAKEHEDAPRESSRERSRDDAPPTATVTARREWSTGAAVRRGSPRRGSTERRRYSPRNYSPRRRTSPRRYGSPARYRRGSPKRRSPGGYYSPRRGSPSSRRYSPVTRRSPGRYSPKRRDSPGRYSPRRRDSPGRYSPRRRDSPGRYSPRRRDSPGRYSPRRRDSPGRNSPKRKTSPGARYSPRRRDSPSPTNRGNNVPEQRTPQRDVSPERYSPDRRSLSSSPSRVRPTRSEDEDNNNRNRARRRSRDGSSSSIALSPEDRRQFSSRGNVDASSLNEKNGSTAGYGKRETEGGRRRKNSPKERSQQASDKRKGIKKSPDRSKKIDKSSNDTKKHDDKKNATKDKIRKEKREPHEMPKLKEPEPPNFAVSNKYAFLAECADDVDVSD